MVDLIAASWKIRSASRNVPVDYHLGGGVWDWAPIICTRIAAMVSSTDDDAPAFDYELLRRHGLTNQQEGIQLRTFGVGEDLVTYAFEDPPTIEGADMLRLPRSVGVCE